MYAAGNPARSRQPIAVLNDELVRGCSLLLATVCCFAHLEADLSGWLFAPLLAPLLLWLAALQGRPCQPAQAAESRAAGLGEGAGAVPGGEGSRAT